MNNAQNMLSWCEVDFLDSRWHRFIIYPIRIGVNVVVIVIWIVEFVMSQWAWPFTFGHWNVIASSLSQSGRLCRIRRTSLEAILRYCIDKNGMDGLTTATNKRHCSTLKDKFAIFLLLSVFKQVSHLCTERVTAFDSSSSFLYYCWVIPSFLWQPCKKIQSSSCAKMYSRIQLKLMKVQQTALVKFSVHSLKLRYIKHKIAFLCYYSSKDQRGKKGGFTLKTATLEMTGFIWVTQTAEHLH